MLWLLFKASLAISVLMLLVGAPAAAGYVLSGAIALSLVMAFGFVLNLLFD